jgi:hypothetical protein
MQVAYSVAITNSHYHNPLPYYPIVVEKPARSIKLIHSGNSPAICGQLLVNFISSVEEGFMRPLSERRGNAFRNCLASTWRHGFSWTPVFLMAAMVVCPSAHAFVTAADFNGLESRIESGNINRPLGVAVDGNGNVYIAQSSVVLKESLSPDGNGYTETVIARIEGVERVSIAVDGAGNVFLGMDGAVYKETLSDGSYRQSTIASNVKQPDWIAVDGRGNVYIADNGDNRVLKETPSGDLYAQSVVFSPSTSGANSLNGLAVDALGKVYCISDGNVWKSTPAAGAYHTTRVLAGTYGRGLAVDGAGNLYVTVGSTQVLQETLSGGRYTQSTVATAHLSVSAGLAVDYSGNLYVGDLLGNRVLKEYATSSPLPSRSSTNTDPNVSMLSAPDGSRKSQ